jgi:glucose-6-phosphate 1-dehydrogenase
MNRPVFENEAKVPPGATTAPPCVFVIFGASGDLTKRLLMPALYNLLTEGLLDQDFTILGVAHSDRSEDEFRETLMKSVSATLQEAADAGKLKPDFQAIEWLGQRVHYLSGDFGDPQTYEKLTDKLKLLTKGKAHRNAVFYLATAPNYFATVVEGLSAAGLTNESENAWRRIVIEKPFGTDLASAKALNACILSLVGEDQIFRIDHYLGKETVQNIMVLRFANFMFEPIWNRTHIDHIEITAAETVGVETRGRFYDMTGALRDMVPNHMCQLLAMMAMEAPNSFDADAIRAEKAKVIEAIRTPSPEEIIRNTVRGQYTDGVVKGEHMPAYRNSRDVDPQSQTETYIAMKMHIDNWRWMDVPFYIRTGKALKERRTEVAIQFKRAPGVLFRETDLHRLPASRLVFHIQPDEGISMRFAAKQPGRSVRLADVDMDFRYGDYFKTAPSTGYETLIYDCLVGDATLFQRADNVEAGWRAVQPLIDFWAEQPGELHPYFAGSSGPSAADELLRRDGRHWLPLA